MTVTAERAEHDGAADREPARGVRADDPDPGVRGAGVRAVPRQRGTRLRPSVDRPGGVGGRRLLAAGRHRRDHLQPPRPRALPGQGPASRADDGRAAGPGHRDQQGPRRVDAHRRPGPGHLRRQRDRRRGRADRRRRGAGRQAAQGQQRRGVVLRGRRGGAGRLPRGGQPGGAVAAADGVLLREQRLRGVLPDRRPASGADGRPRRRLRARVRAGRRQRRGGGRRGHDRCRRARPRGRRPGVRGGRHLPLARPLRGRPGEVPQQGRADGVAAARPPGHHPRAAARPRRRAGKDRLDRGPGAGQDRRRRRRRPAGAAAGHERAPLLGVRTAPGRPRAGLDAGPGRRDLPHHGRGAAGAGGRARGEPRGVRGRGRRRQGRQRVRPYPRPVRQVARPAAGHADLGDRGDGARRSAARWRA